MMSSASTNASNLFATTAHELDVFDSCAAQDLSVTNATNNNRTSSPSHAASKDMSFTPQRARGPPRAWERRPAVPFVPRNEGQKIWKRVPLGELGTETNKATSLRSTEREKRDYMRVVKKQKIGHATISYFERCEEAQTENDSDKENIAHGPTSGKTEMCVVEFVGTKSEEDLIDAGGSPKKKLRQVLPELTHPNIAIEQNQTSRLQHRSDEITIDSHEAELTQDDESLFHERGTIVIEDTLSKRRITDEVECEAQTSAGQLCVGKALGKTDVLIPSAITFEQPLIDRDAETETHKRRDCVASNCILSDKSLVCENGQEAESNSMTKETTHEMKQSETLPRETIGENLWLKLHSYDGEASDVVTPQNQSQTHDDVDDTAFLTDFLSRAKAQKAARQIEPQQKIHVELTEKHVLAFMEDESEQQIPHLEGLENKLLGEAAPLFLPASTEDDNMMLSPRRSSRTATVRSTAQTNKTKAIPSTIHLKRAQGNEFIFNASKAQAASQAAAQTRSNTKRNKGKAIDVQSRLEQLKNGKECTVEESTEGKAASSETSQTNNIASQSEIVKKKKRDKVGNGQKQVKVLKWNETELVRYREPSPYAWEDESSPESCETQKFAEKPETMLSASTNTAQMNANAKKLQSVSGDESGKLRIRRVRRGVAGANNGTPASKRMKNMIDEIEDDEMPEPMLAEPLQTISTTNGTNISSVLPSSNPPVRKSRMPVPVSTATSKLRQPTNSVANAASAITSAGGTKLFPEANSADSASNTADLPRRRTLRGRGVN